MSLVKFLYRILFQIFTGNSYRILYWEIKGCKIGKGVRLHKYISITNPSRIIIGNHVEIQHHSSLFVNPLHESAKLIIGDGVKLGKYNDFGCSNLIIIEKNVLTAPFVHLTDRNHDYDNPNIPIMDQTASSKGPITIKEGCWLGFGVQVMSGVTIGRNCVVAAGSIVTKNIPDYSIVAGNPAKIIKQFNRSTNRWEKITI